MNPPTSQRASTSSNSTSTPSKPAADGTKSIFTAPDSLLPAGAQAQVDTSADRRNSPFTRRLVPSEDEAAGIRAAAERSVAAGLRASGGSIEQSPIQHGFPVAWGSQASTGQKRKAEEAPPATPDKLPSADRHKQSKLRRKRNIRHNLGVFSLPGVPGTLFEPPLQPPSPLFFSNSPKPRPTLPPRFSSSEAGETMLSKARGEDKHVKTVSLAKGTITTPAYMPNAPTSNPGRGRAHSNSVDRSSTARSSSSDGGTSTMGKEGPGGMGAMLNSIGIVELLEQDERPTFVIDLGEPANYGAGQIYSLFVNQALQSHAGLHEQITGSANTPTPEPQNFLHFKSWLLSASIGGESLNVCLPACPFAGLVWNCSTLRKRLRIISGSFSSPAAASNGAATLTNVAETGLSGQSGSASTGPPLSVGSNALTNLEPSDYFGAAAAPAERAAMSGGSKGSEVVPTTESTAVARLNPPDHLMSGAENRHGSASVDLLPSPST